MGDSYNKKLILKKMVPVRQILYFYTVYYKPTYNKNEKFKTTKHGKIKVWFF